MTQAVNVTGSLQCNGNLHTAVYHAALRSAGRLLRQVHAEAFSENAI